MGLQRKVFGGEEEGRARSPFYRVTSRDGRGRYCNIYCDRCSALSLSLFVFGKMAGASEGRTTYSASCARGSARSAVNYIYGNICVSIASVIYQAAPPPPGTLLTSESRWCSGVWLSMGWESRWRVGRIESSGDYVSRGGRRWGS